MPILQRSEDHPLRSIHDHTARNIRYRTAAESLERRLQESATGTERDLLEQNCVSIHDPSIPIAATGFLLNTFGFVLTCLHVVDHFLSNPQKVRDYRVKERDGSLSEIDPSFFAYDQENDLAILRARRGTTRVPRVYFSKRELTPGEDLHYYSFKGENPVYHLGKVQDTSEPGIFTFSGYGEPGYSGSALFDNQGKYVGTLFGKVQVNGKLHIRARKAHIPYSLVEEIIANLKR
ncbi:serine protease [Candidatus Woesearchaeota archaeon]|nr:serine protease [Candidatus Woesearchaeota archaeon]